MKYDLFEPISKIRWKAVFCPKLNCCTFPRGKATVCDVEVTPSLPAIAARLGGPQAIRIDSAFTN
tara:strand:+ start:6125 stop:6319 length:195 start_codon:yes stop_codon:yes gene_type:complete